MRGVVSMNNYLQSNRNNIGIQIHWPTSKLGLSGSVVDSWGRMSVGMYNWSTIPVRSCRRDDNSLDNVKPDDSIYCSYDNKFTYYNVGGGVLKKINDSTFDVYSFFRSEKALTNINFALSVIVVEDSIYDDQKEIDGTTKKVYHRNIMRGYCEIPSGAMPTTIFAGKTYVFVRRMKVNVVADESKLKVVVVAMNMANKTFLNAGIEGGLPPSEVPQICMTTADSLNRNNIIWQPLNSKGKIYIEKETNITNKYKIIDSVASGKPRIYTDLNSNSAIKPETYRLIFKDTSSVLAGLTFTPSASSLVHKTMHLSINKGTGNDWNLIWSSYIGFPVVSYDIYRRFGSGAWSKIGSVSGSVNSYTDLNVSGSNVAYKISVVAPNACDPNAWARLSSESNIADQNYSRNVKLQQNDLSLQPNPAENNLTLMANIRVGFIKGYTIKDLAGRVVSSGEVNQIQANIDISNLKQGSYMLTAYFGNGEISKQFIRL